VTTNDGTSVTTKVSGQVRVRSTPHRTDGSSCRERESSSSPSFHHKSFLIVSQKIQHCTSQYGVLWSFFCIRESRATIIRDLNSLGRCLGIHPLYPCLPQHLCHVKEHSPWCRVHSSFMRHSPSSPRVIKVGHSCLPPFSRQWTVSDGPISAHSAPVPSWLNQFPSSLVLCNAHDVLVM